MYCGVMFMHIRLLGSLEVEDGLRRLGPADLGGRKPKQLLEILLAERGRVVSKDRIADLLWHDELPQVWTSAVRYATAAGNEELREGTRSELFEERVELSRIPAFPL